MTNYVVHCDPDFLEHHGVEGQQWGKRNGPPYPLDKQGKADLKEQKKKAKLESYKERETGKLQRRLDKESVVGQKHADKNGARIDKELNKESVNYNKLQKSVNRFQDQATRDLTKQGVTILEMAKVKNMTIKEMNEERKAVGIAVGKSIGATIASVGISASLNLPITVLFTPDVKAVKTNQRVSNKEYGEILKIASETTRNGLSKEMINAGKQKALEEQSSRVTGKEESDFWKAYAKELEKSKK